MTDLFLRPVFDWRTAVASPYGPPNPTTRHVLLTLSLHMSPSGDSCFPSIDLLTVESGLSRRAVVQHMQLAAEAGWIGKRDRAERSGQGWRRVEYTATIPAGVEELVKAWLQDRANKRFLALKAGAPDAPRKGSAPNAPAKAGARPSEGGAPDALNAVHEVHLSSPLSSSKSSSGGRAVAHTPRPGSDYSPPQTVIDWVNAQGYGAYLNLHVEKFRDTCATQARKAYKPEGLDAAFRNCVRDDWGRVRQQAKQAERNGERPQAATGKDWWRDARQVDDRARKLGLDWQGPNVEAYTEFAQRVRKEFEKRAVMRIECTREERSPA
jgi:hypothetical protein